MWSEDRAILPDKNRKGGQLCGGNCGAAGGYGTSGHRTLASIIMATGVVRDKRDRRFRAIDASVLRMGLNTCPASKGKHEDQHADTDH